MGGRRSTRWNGQYTRRAMESCYSITAKLSHRGACFRFEEPCVWLWKHGGFSVIYELREESGITILKLVFTRYGHETTQHISLCSTRPNFGGIRWPMDKIGTLLLVI